MIFYYIVKSSSATVEGDFYLMELYGSIHKIRGIEI